MPQTIVAGFAGGYIFEDSDYMRCQVCQTGSALTVFSTEVLGLISLDRFIFIKFPLRYDRVVIIPRVIVTIVIAWLPGGYSASFWLGEYKFAYSVSTCLASFMGANILYAVFLVVLALIPIILIIITNIWIVCILP